MEELRCGAASSSGNSTSAVGCHAELALSAISLGHFLLSVTILCCCVRRRGDDARERRHPGHYLRAFVVLALLVVYVLETMERAINGHASSPLGLLLAMAPTMALLAATALHIDTETRRSSPLWPCFGLALWTASLACRSSTIIMMTSHGLRWHHVRLALSAAACAMLIMLTVVDAYAIVQFCRKRNFYDVNKKTLPKRMDSKSSYKYNNANAYSQMTFWWLNKLLFLGYKDPLELEDLGILPQNKNSSVCFEDFYKIYNREKKKIKQPSGTFLWKCYLKYIYLNYILGGVCKLMGDCVGLVGPLGIAVIIDFAKTYGGTAEKNNKDHYLELDEFFGNGYVVGVIIFISAIAQGTLSQSSTHLVNIEGIRLKSALQALIYDKCLKLTLWSNKGSNIPSDSENMKNSMDTGAVTNLIAEDSYNVMRFVWIGHYVWAIPLKITVIMYLLYLKLGISAVIASILCIVVMTPLQFLVGKAMSSNSVMCIERSDQRMMKINEILQGIKILKMHGWEDVYEKKVFDTREQELTLLNKDSIYWALITFLTHASSTLITLVTFGLYSIIEKKEMTPAAVFTGLALFNQLTVPLFIFPVIVPIIISAIVSTKRLQDFLALPEVSSVLSSSEEYSVKNYENQLSNPLDVLSTESHESMKNILGNIQEADEDHNSDNSMRDATSEDVSTAENCSFTEEKCALIMNDSQFVWGQKNQYSSKLTVLNTVKIPKGKITMIIGKTGSGKTSLLSALLGEMSITNGDMSWSKDSTLAYVSQVPWLLNTTIRENIIFGTETHPRKYKKVLSICCLQPDLAMFPNKDQTEVGEAGCGLSGGQKQRISLARAIYSNASVLILDDPLSALDQNVSQKMFDKGIKKFCSNHKKTVIMTTHNLKLLSHADEIIYIDDGVARSVGTLTNVENLEPNLAYEWKKLMNQCVKDDDTEMSREKTAKERWQLVKLINKFSSHLKMKPEDGDVEKRSYIPLRKRLSTFNGSKYLTHDLLLPTDECDDEVICSSLPKRSSTKRSKTKSMNRVTSKKHKTAERASSLQVMKKRLKPSPMKRQSSTPSMHYDIDKDISVLFDPNASQLDGINNKFPNKCHPTELPQTQSESFEIVRQGSRIKRFFSRTISKKRRSNSNEENEHMPIKRLISTNSNLSEDFSEENDIDINSSTSGQQTLEEEREYGKISKQIYLQYFLSCGLFTGTFYVISTICWQVMRVYTDICLSEWTSQNSKDMNVSFFLYLYSFLSAVSILLSLLSNALGQYAGAVARKTLHERLLENILKCPLTFFQSTPLGRIINRFSIDMGVIDKKIATSMQRLLQFLFLCSSAIVINAIINPWFLIIALPICIFYYTVQKFYRSSARELQRLDAMTKSPIFSHFNETLSGVSSIRAYNQQSRFSNMLWNKMDVNTNAFIILNSSSCWLGIALDYLGAFIVFITINISLASIKSYPDQITPALVGLAINYTLLVPIYLNWVVKFLSDMEMYMSAVERVLQYSRLPVEDYRENLGFVPKDWLKKGEIRFKSVSLQYGDVKEPVLKTGDLFIPAGQKVALCGRTGSGKSSLLLSLLSMINVSDGTITIDAIDLKNIPVHMLRKSIAIVPQDALIFSGTVRENLNPNDDHTDEEIWKVLELTQLKGVIGSYPGKLDGIINEGGQDWNYGARQLMGIAQSILKKSPILLLDEPTAALDPQTENTLLNALLDSQKHRTIITVAHRLKTIINYDRVLIVDAGKIVEDGSPKELLSNPASIFRSMANAIEK